MRPGAWFTTSVLIGVLTVVASCGFARHATAQIFSGPAPNYSLLPRSVSAWGAESTAGRRGRSATWRGPRSFPGQRYGTIGASDLRYGFVPRHERMNEPRHQRMNHPTIARQVPTEPGLVFDESPVREEGVVERNVEEVLEELVDPLDESIDVVGEPGLEPELGYEAWPAGECQGDCVGPCGECCLFPFPIIPLENMTLSGGVQGMKNPSNLDRDGSFGFNIGLNWGAPFWVMPYSGVGMQFGVRGIFSDLSGASFTTERRNQFFLTTGLFRRTDWGLQGGVVFDYMRDDWYSGVDLNQLRGELSWVFPCWHEWGFWFSASDHNDQSISPIDQGIDAWDPTDLYAFFYRRRFHAQIEGEGRFFAGFTQRGDGLIGVDAIRDLTDWSSFEVSFTYLIPDEPRGAGASENEGWNVFMGIVWYPPCHARDIGCGDDYRPLFRVADNGSFMVDRSR